MAVEATVKEIVDFMLDLVEVAVPFAEPRKLNIPSSAQANQNVKDGQSTIMSSRMTNSQFGHGVINDPTNEEKENSKEEELVVEVQIASNDNKRTCCVCDSPRVAFQAIKNGKINRICSDACMNVYKSIITRPPCVHCHQNLAPNAFGFKPTFGQLTGVACSEDCLEKYDYQKGPKARCKSAACASVMSDEMYHWQTMDFCSPKCVNEILSRLGKYCAHCNKLVSMLAIGKFSVRFGEIVRQFCSIACLGAYKKLIRSCTFCQTEVSTKTISMLSLRPIERDLGEGVKVFCSTACLDDHIRTDAEKKIYLEAMTSDLRSGDICDICCCFCPTEYPNTSSDYIFFQEGTIQEQIANNTKGDSLTVRITSTPYVFLCSPRCASAYRFKKGHNGLFCFYCFKVEWNIRQGVVLRFGHRQRIFCTKRCMNLFIIRIRKLQFCDCCKCQKYQFDLIEMSNPITGEVKYYCSLNCLNPMAETRQIVAAYGADKLSVIKCTYCLKIQPGLIHVLDDRMDEGPQAIRSFCSNNCYTTYQKKVESEKQQEEQRKKQEALAAQMEARQRGEANYSRNAADLPNLRAQLTINTNTVNGLKSTPRVHPIPPKPTDSPSIAPRFIRDSTDGWMREEPQRTERTEPQRSGPVRIRELVVAQEAPKQMFNASVQCCPKMVTKAVMCRPHLVDAGCQTDPMT